MRKALYSVCRSATLGLFVFFALPGVALAYNITNSGTSYGAQPAWGYIDTHGTAKAATQFTTTGAGCISSLTFHGKTSGSPVDQSQVTITTDSGGAPGVGVATSTAFSYSGGTTDTQYTVSFNTPVSVDASTNYWLVSSRTGSGDNANYYNWASTLSTTPNTRRDTGIWDWYNNSDYSGNYDITVGACGGGGGGGGGGSFGVPVQGIPYQYAYCTLASSSVCMTYAFVAATTTLGATSTPIVPYGGADFNEWLLAVCVIIIMLSPQFWRAMFAPVNDMYV